VRFEEGAVVYRGRRGIKVLRRFAENWGGVSFVGARSEGRSATVGC